MNKIYLPLPGWSVQTAIESLDKTASTEEIIQRAEAIYAFCNSRSADPASP